MFEVLLVIDPVCEELGIEVLGLLYLTIFYRRLNVL